MNSLKNLKNQIQEHCPDIELLGTATSVAEGQVLLQKLNTKIDLAFMDIQLSDGLIFNLLDQNPNITFNIIFVTAFSEYAIQACRYSSIDYVQKPIDPDKLIEAVKRYTPRADDSINERLDVFKEYYTNPNIFSKMSISAVDGIYFVNIKDMVRLEGEDNYTHIYLSLIHI